MKKTQQERVPLNARITLSVRRAFDVEAARRGLTKQEALEAALRLWIRIESVEGQAEELPPFPVFPAKSARKFNLTREQIDEATLG